MEVCIEERIVKRRERRVGGCERSIVEECILLKRGIYALVRLPSANFVSDNCDGDNESV